VATIIKSLSKRSRAHRILTRVAVPLPAWLLWGVAATLSLGWSVTALGIAVALSETTSTWWVVLPFGMAPAIAVLVSVDRVIKRLLPDGPAENPSTDQSHVDRVSHDAPEILHANGNGRPVLVDDLTDREREVLALLTTGRTNGEIAGELFVANGTVKSHVNAICRKLGARNRTEAVARARAVGLVDDG
jgi:DNA-binding CsgD family transcriptional regulator